MLVRSAVSNVIRQVKIRAVKHKRPPCRHVVIAILKPRSSIFFLPKEIAVFIKSGYQQPAACVIIRNAGYNYLSIGSFKSVPGNAGGIARQKMFAYEASLRKTGGEECAEENNQTIFHRTIMSLICTGRKP